MEHYFIENNTIGYKEFGKYQYPVHALQWFKMWLKRENSGKIYYLRNADDAIIAKGKAVPTGICWLLSPRILGFGKVGEEY